MSVKLKNICIEKRLKNLTATFESGIFTVILGPNASGKTTLLQSVAGILDFSSGEIFHEEKNIKEFLPIDRARQVVYLSSELRTDFPVTVKEYVEMGIHCFKRGLFFSLSEEEKQRIATILEKCELKELENKNIQYLSSGERQRIQVARVLVQGPKVLLLDESLSRMDLHYQIKTAKLLRQYANSGHVVIWVSHDVNLALAFSDFYFLLAHGEIKNHGAIKDPKLPALLKEIYPVQELRVEQSPSGRANIFFENSDLI